MKVLLLLLSVLLFALPLCLNLASLASVLGWYCYSHCHKGIAGAIAIGGIAVPVASAIVVRVLLLLLPLG